MFEEIQFGRGCQSSWQGEIQLAAVRWPSCRLTDTREHAISRESPGAGGMIAVPPAPIFAVGPAMSHASPREARNDAGFSWSSRCSQTQGKVASHSLGVVFSGQPKPDQ